jgi:hypothetical protein
VGLRGRRVATLAYFSPHGFFLRRQEMTVADIAAEELCSRGCNRAVTKILPRENHAPGWAVQPFELEDGTIEIIIDKVAAIEELRDAVVSRIRD